MSIRRFLQWVEVFPDGYENPMQIELESLELSVARSKFEEFKGIEGSDYLSKADTYIKVGSVRIVDFKDRSKEKGMIIYE